MAKVFKSPTEILPLFQGRNQRRLLEDVLAVLFGGKGAGYPVPNLSFTLRHLKKLFVEQ